MRPNLLQSPPSPEDVKATDREIGNRVRKLRRELGLTQQDLAGAVGVSYQQIQKYERGMNRVSASRLLVISSVLGTTPLYFFEGLNELSNPGSDGRPGSEGKRPIVSERVQAALTNLVSALKESSVRQAGDDPGG